MVIRGPGDLCLEDTWLGVSALICLPVDTWINAGAGTPIGTQTDIGNSLGKVDLLTFNPRKSSVFSQIFWWHPGILNGLGGLFQFSGLQRFPEIFYLPGPGQSPLYLTRTNQCWIFNIHTLLPQ